MTKLSQQQPAAPWLGRLMLTAALAAVTTSCSEQRLPSGVVPDDLVPTASIETAVDTIDINQGLQFTISVNDNVGLKTVSVSVTGAVVFAFDTTFSAPVLSFNKSFNLTIAAGAAGGAINLAVRVTDGAGNEATASRDVTIFDPVAPQQTLLLPAPGAAFGAGDTALVVVRSVDPSGVVKSGARLFVQDALGQPITISADSVTYGTPQFGVTDSLRVAIPDTLNPGTYLMGTFAVDGAGNRGDGPSVNVGVIDLTGPTGSFVSPPMDSMVVAGDSVLVRFRAQDLTGVDSVRLRGIVVRGDSALGTAVTVTRLFPKTARLNGSTDTTFSRYLTPVTTDSTPERVTLEATVFDVGDNASTITSAIQIVRGPFARVASPADGSQQPVGQPLPIQVAARSPNTVEWAGFIASGVVSGADSIQFGAPLADSVLAALSLPIPTTADLGTVTVTPFAIDAIGKRFTGAPIAVTLTDAVAPTITFVQPATGTLLRAGDSLRVAVQVQDNRGVANVNFVGVAHRGDRDLGTDTVVVRLGQKSVTLPQPADTTIRRDLLSDPNDQTAEPVYVRVTAVDSSGNAAKDSVLIEMVVGPALTILAPGDSSVAAPGKSITITLRGLAASGIGKLGYFTSGVLVTGDTVNLPTTDPQVRDTTLDFVLSIPAANPLGFFTISPFGQDSIGNTGTGKSITVELVASAGVGDTIPPLITDAVDLRAEVDDSITVRAIDVGGITRVGFVITDLTGTAVLAGDSLDFTGVSTDITRSFVLGLDTISTFPLQVVVTAFGIDSIGNRGVLSRTGQPLGSGGAADTVTLVAGRTVPLPMGGRIIDAIYNRNLNEVYMTNVELDQLEIFDVGSTSFVSSVPIGSRPWGVALWPLDTLGTNDDRVIIANSGGTDLSIVDATTRREINRHALPNFLIQTVTTERDDETGVIQIKITEHDFSDRPQFLGTTCRTAGLTTCHPDSIYAVYSTTPTIDQGEFPLRGSIRWENIGTTPVAESHFFWEQAVVPPAPDFDTLQVIVDRGPTLGQETILAAACGIMVDTEQLVFRDTTYVRNSGNFTHALVGEGGVIGEGFGRAVGYNGNRVVTDSLCSGTITVGDSTFTLPDGPLKRDFGVTPGIRVRDFISNTATRVNSVAINFNGLTNLIRTTDSVYVLNEPLRLKGLIAAVGANAGMDLNFDHAFEAGIGGTPGTFGGTADSTNRVVFLATDNPTIEVFDTFFFSRTATVPIKEPVIGPLRVARLPSGDQIIIGVTASGVVMVQLPQIDNPFPAPPAFRGRR